jgi:1-acyl-sn-glycerol-3-phosphate acyltransferase
VKELVGGALWLPYSKRHMRAESVPEPNDRQSAEASGGLEHEGDTVPERAVAQMCEELAPGSDASADGDTLLSELLFDSLACAELTAALEERFGVRLVDGDINETRTVGEVAATVRTKMPERPRIPPGIGSLQQPIKAIAGWAFRWQARLKVVGQQNVPSTGPVIIAANHRSMLDVPLLVIACPRPVTFMAKRELFRGPILRWGFHVLGGFPVRRQIADVRAMDIGLAVLERGDVLGLYPEGTRSKKGEMLPFLKGAAWLALKVGAPIVPCGITGTERRGKYPQPLKKVRVAFGPRVEVERATDARERRARAEEITTRLLDGINALVR